MKMIKGESIKKKSWQSVGFLCLNKPHSKQWMSTWFSFRLKKEEEEEAAQG